MRQMWAQLHDTHRESVTLLYDYELLLHKNADWYNEITTKGSETKFTSVKIMDQLNMELDTWSKNNVTTGIGWK